MFLPLTGCLIELALLFFIYTPKHHSLCTVKFQERHSAMLCLTVETSISHQNGFDQEVLPHLGNSFSCVQQDI